MSLFHTILFAADFSGRSRAAFEIACSLADGKTRLIVLHVVEPPILYGELGVAFPLVGAEPTHHRALKEQLRSLYVPNQPIEVEYLACDGFAAEAILSMAEESQSDLIVMGTHGRTGMDRLLMGSVAEAVLRRARCPVLTLRCPAHQETPAIQPDLNLTMAP